MDAKNEDQTPKLSVKGDRKALGRSLRDDQPTDQEVEGGKKRSEGLICKTCPMPAQSASSPTASSSQQSEESRHDTPGNHAHPDQEADETCTLRHPILRQRAAQAVTGNEFPQQD